MRFRTIGALLVSSFIMVADAGATSLILNGGFESGLTDWITQTRQFTSNTGVCNDAFASQSTGAGCATLANPVDGSFSAYSSITISSAAPAGTEWIDDLSQEFTVPVSFEDAEISFENEFAVTSDESSFRGGIVAINLYAGNTATNNAFFISGDDPVADPPTNDSLAWTPESWDVTSVLAPYAGEAVTLDLRTIAFVGDGAAADVDVAAGFDDVAATFTNPTPEPSAWLTFAGGLLFLVVGRKYAKNRASTRHA